MNQLEGAALRRVIAKLLDYLGHCPKLCSVAGPNATTEHERHTKEAMVEGEAGGMDSGCGKRPNENKMSDGDRERAMITREEE